MELFSSELIKIIGALIAGGGAWEGFRVLLSKRQQDSLDYNSIIETWKEDNERLRELNSVYLKKLNDLERTINQLQVKLILLESTSYEFPFPFWLKDLSGRMLVLNRAYETEFLIPLDKQASDYVGHFDHDIWPSEMARSFSKNDSKANITKEAIKEEFFFETTESWYDVYKFPWYIGGTSIGVGGAAFKKNKK